MDLLGKLSEVFPISAVISMNQYGSGHIHDTYFLETKSETAFVAQRFNRDIFSDPYTVEHNYELLRKLLGNSEIFKLEYLKGKSGSIFENIEGDLWRISPFIQETMTYDVCEDDSLAFNAASAFARFIKELSETPPHQFKEAIPNFLNPAVRYLQFKASLEQASDTLLKKAGHLIDAYTYHNPTVELESLTAQLPKRVIHGDTKINNILFRKDDEVVSIIDVDTTMPGYTMCDFGDLVRTTCNKTAEDDPDPKHAGLKTSIYDQIFNAFKEQNFLTPIELNSLPLGVHLMTWLTGIRFLTDYLNRNIYYKIHREDHNLDRAQSQMNFLIKLKDYK